jgi:uncharacterized membrane protein YwaF
MLNFLNEEGCIPKKKVLFFDITQIIAFVIVCIAMPLSVFFILSSVNNEVFSLMILRTISTTSLGLMILRILNHIFVLKDFDPSKLLPLHLCGLGVMLCFLATYTQNPILYDTLLGLTPIPALCAVLFPETAAAKYPRLKFRSIEFYFSHTNLFMTPVFAVHFLPSANVNLGYMPQFLLVLVIFVIVAVTANGITKKGNYMYLRNAPSGTPLIYIERKFGLIFYRFIVVAFLVVCYLLMHLLYFLAK